MKNKILIVMFAIVSSMGHLQAQITEPPTDAPCDSVVMQTAVFFSKGKSSYIEKNNYKSIGHFLKWAQTDTQTPIVITGWTDKSGSKTANKKISLLRATTVRNYLIRKGIAPERISFKGGGEDRLTVSYAKARRTDVQGIIRRGGNTPQPVDTPQLVICEQKPEPLRKDTVAEKLPTPKPASKPVAKPVAKPVVAEPIAEPVTEAVITEPAHLRWYAGVEAGVPLGISTFTSFTSNGKPGFEAGILGGYRLSPLLSAELGISFGQMKLGASKCCSDYFLGADGVRYLEHVTGMDSYSYKDIYSSVSLQQYALRLNVDMLQIVNPNWNNLWSLTFSPAIYGIATKATLKEIGNNHKIIKRDGRFQFGAGVGIGGAYRITRNLNIGLRTGTVWIFGERYDGIAPTDHNENMIWNNTLSLIWRFGK